MLWHLNDILAVMLGVLKIITNDIVLQEIPEDFNMKDKVEGILTSIDAGNKRARVMDLDDFMV